MQELKAALEAKEAEKVGVQRQLHELQIQGRSHAAPPRDDHEAVQGIIGDMEAHGIGVLPALAICPIPRVQDRSHDSTGPCKQLSKRWGWLVWHDRFQMERRQSISRRIAHLWMNIVSTSVRTSHLLCVVFSAYMIGKGGAVQRLCAGGRACGADDGNAVRVLKGVTLTICARLPTRKCSAQPAPELALSSRQQC